MAKKQIALSVEDLHKSFGNVEVLKGIYLTATKGDVISVLGSSGSGKSTLLRCINFLEMPNRGKIIIGGEEILLKKNRKGVNQPKDIRQVERIRSKLSMVFQQFNLWSHMTILENVIEA
ncbi:MAG: ATP-binding cassette domain-containing protein, partial [Desulfobacula sp.]|nr:ATP-binding cassette domain-containing protein [Desulfobacula sp.]